MYAVGKVSSRAKLNLNHEFIVKTCTRVKAWAYSVMILYRYLQNKSN